MIDSHRSSYGIKVNCPDTGYEEICSWKGKHPDICLMVINLKSEVLFRRLVINQGAFGICKISEMIDSQCYSALHGIRENEDVTIVGGTEQARYPLH